MCNGFDPPTNLCTLFYECMVLQSVDKAVLLWKEEMGAVDVALQAALNRQGKANAALWNVLMPEDP